MQVQPHRQRTIGQFLDNGQRELPARVIHAGYHVNRRNVVKVQQAGKGLVLRLHRVHDAAEEPLVLGLEGRPVHHRLHHAAGVGVVDKLLRVPDGLLHHAGAVCINTAQRIHHQGNAGHVDRFGIPQNNMHQGRHGQRVGVVVNLLHILERVVGGPVPDVPLVERDPGPPRHDRQAAQFTVRAGVHAQRNIHRLVDQLVGGGHKLLANAAGRHRVGKDRPAEIVVDADHVRLPEQAEQHRPVPLRIRPPEAADDHLDRRVHAFHLADRLRAPGRVLGGRLLPALPVAVNLVAQPEQLHAIRLFAAVRAAQVGIPRRRRAVHIFHQVGGVVGRLRVRVDRQVQLRANLPAQRPRLGNAERGGLRHVRDPEQLGPRPFRDRAHQLLPVEIGEPAAAGIPDEARAQLPQRLQDIRPDAVGARQRAGRIVKAVIDAPAGQLDELAEQPLVDCSESLVPQHHNVRIALRHDALPWPDPAALYRCTEIRTIRTP